MSFKNGSLRIQLLHIPKILQHPPWPAKKEYKCCTSCNNGNGAWGFHWKYGHDEWKNKQGKKPSVHFSNPVNNAIMYCSYLMTTSQESTAEEENVEDDSQENDLISLSHVELLEWLIKRVYSPPLLPFHYLRCQCGPGYCLIGKIIGDGVWGQASSSVTITQVGFLLINHLIMWRISMSVRLITWNQGRYMNEYWCDSSVVWNHINIHSYIYPGFM